MRAAVLAGVVALSIGTGSATAAPSPPPRVTGLRNFENLDDMPGWRRAAWYAGGPGFSAVAPWIRLVKSDAATAAQVRAAGLSSYDYADPNLCSGRTATGGFVAGYPNPYAFPDCSEIGDLAAYYTAPGGAPAHDSVLATAQHCTTCNENGAYEQLFVDPSAPAFAAYWADAIRKRYGSAAPFDFLQIDDAAPPPDTVYKGLCWGWSRPVAPNGCASPARNAAQPWGATYSLATWLAGESALAAAPAAAGARVFYNGMGPALSNGAAHVSPAAQVALDRSDALGAMCENCMGGTNPNLLSDNGGLIGYRGATPLFDLIATEIAFTNHDPQKVVLYLMRDGDGEPVALGLVAQDMARIMLALTPQNVYYRGPCRNPSFVDACIESALTWSDPYVASSQVASPYALLADQSGGAHVGVYYREYRSCAYLGEPIGPCAAVVANDVRRGMRHELPLGMLHNTYTGSLTIDYATQPGFPHEGSLCGCFGDVPSTLAFDAPLPTALAAVDGATRPFPSMAAILFTPRAADVARGVNARRRRAAGAT